MGSSQIWQGRQPWPHAFPKGGFIHFFPHAQAVGIFLMHLHACIFSFTWASNFTPASDWFLHSRVPFFAVVHPLSSHWRFCSWFPYSHGWKSLFWKWREDWRRVPDFWVVVESFTPMWSYWSFGEINFSPGAIFPQLTLLIFGSRDVSFNPTTCICCVVHPCVGLAE